MTARAGSRRLRRLIIALTLVAGLAVLFSTWFSHRLMGAMLTGAAFSSQPSPQPTDPLQPGYRGDPQAALGLAFETLQIETDLGPAPAWLVPAPGPDAGGAQLAAIFVHGIGEAREDGYPYLAALHRAAVPVLLMSYRQDPDAPRAPEGLHLFGLTEWEDLEAAILALRARGITRVVLVGRSSGAAVIGQFLARSNQAPQVAGLILDTPALDFPAVLQHVTERLQLPLRSLGARLAIPAFALTDGVDLGRARALPAIAAFDGPVLVVQGRDDRLVPLSQVQDLLEARSGGTTVVLTASDAPSPHPAARIDSMISDLIAGLGSR